MERRNLLQFDVASAAWQKNGFVELDVLRDLAEVIDLPGSFHDIFDRLVLAFNGSTRSRSAIEKAMRQKDPHIIALKQHLVDLGAWSAPYSSISSSSYQTLKATIAEEGRFNPYSTKAKLYPYYQPGLTVGYDIDWVKSALKKARDRFHDFQQDRTSDTAILVGNGPSLNRVDFDLFKGRDVFISNYAIKHPDLRAVAKGVAVTNYLVAEQEPFLFGLDPGIWKFFPFWLRHTLHPDDRTILLNAEGGDLFFSKDVLESVAWHSTVSFFWLQLLYSAGYERVLMTGFDNTYKQSSTAKEGDLVDQKEDDPNHFDPTYFKGKQWQAADTEKMEDTYLLSKQKYEESGRDLVNCTVGGALEVLRRAPLESELKLAKIKTEVSVPRIALVTAFWEGDAVMAEKHWRASRRFSPPGIDHIHLFKHGYEQLPKLTMRQIICADIEAHYPEASRKPHPAGPNLTFARAVTLMKDLGYTHFFWFEPDCVPTQVGWFEPFQTAIMDHPDEPIIGVGGGTVVPNKPHWKNHFAGCSAYNVEALSSLDWNRFLKSELDVSFDVWLSKELGYIELGEVNNQDQSDTIIFGPDRYNWTVKRNPKSVTVGMFEHWRPEKFLSKEQLKDRLGWKQFSLFHAIKDPELLELSAMRKRPKAAIIIINYNNAKFIRQSIESALANRGKYESMDIVVVDDGSTDDSQSIIHSFGGAIRPVFLEHGINIPNFNQQRALKAALFETDAEIIYLMDGDDYCLDNRVADSVNYFDDLSVVLVQHALNLVDEQGSSLGGVCAYFPDQRITPEFFAEQNRSNFFQPTSGLAVRRSYLEKSLSWLVADQHSATWLDVRVTRLAPFYGKVVNSKKVLGAWRRHEASDSIRTDNVKERVALHEKWFDSEVRRQRLDLNVIKAKALSKKTLFVGGFSRGDRAEVDETEVVSNLLRARKGVSHTMIDVGAHIGSSAHFFDKLGWRIHCFEPDPKNRAKLKARFGSNERVQIDNRAVSDKPAEQVQFFTSDQSTGISGLHAFHSSHDETGRVDITTLSDVIAERHIQKVDFLKIDVEGFDLNVLQGNPWAELKPDVIECEFEDAKTLKLGHDWKTIANYLKEQGYSVYVSEWHPIIRYGIPHDWRRVFPYGYSEMPKDAWGNLLAFRDDPGLDNVVAAFRAKIRYRKESTESVSLPTSGTYTPEWTGKTSGNRKNTQSDLGLSIVNESATTMLKQTPGYEPLKRDSSVHSERPEVFGEAWYSAPAHWLRARSPGSFEFLRFLRRAMVSMLRRPAMMIFLLAIIGASAWTVYQYPVSTGVIVWVSVVGIILLGLLIYIAHRAHFHAEQLHLKNHALELQVRQLIERRDSSRDRQDAALKSLRASILSDLSGLHDRLSGLGSEISDQGTLVSKFKGDLEAVVEEQTTSFRKIEELTLALTNEAATLKEVSDAVALVRDDNAGQIESLKSNLTDQTISLSTRVNELAAQTSIIAVQGEKVSDIELSVAGLAEQSHSANEKLEAAELRLSSVEKWSIKDNAQWYQRFNRHLNQSHIETFEREWRKRLSLPMNAQVLGYMASRICHTEQNLDGRLATSVEDMLLRALVARSIKSKSVNVLEIGTLFGTGAAIIYDAINPHFEHVHMTLLDPLEGYYNGVQSDVLTGQTVDLETLQRNFRRSGIPESDYSVIKHLSTDLEAVEVAGQQQYDLLIIDGDHSYAGVKTDFENYAQFVKLGGYIIFDDYNSADWPEVKQYVDDEMPKHEFVSLVGSSWRTSVYRVVKPAAKNSFNVSKRPNRSKKSASASTGSEGGD